MRGIQYAAAYRFYRWRLWNTGSPAGACHRAARCADPVAGDDNRGCGAADSNIEESNNVIASGAKQSIAQQARKQEWIASSQALLAMTLRQLARRIVYSPVRSLNERTSAGEKHASRRSRKCRPKASSICGPNRVKISAM